MDHRKAAEFLHVSRATLERWIRQGLLPPPATPEGGYEADELAGWAKTRGLPYGTTARGAGEQHVSIASALTRGSVLPAVKATTSRDAITTIVNSLEHLGEAQRKEVRGKVLDRERMASTAVGHGVALPHPREAPGHLVDASIITVAFFDDPIDWVAPDGELVHSAFLLLSPNPRAHLKLLSRVARLLRAPGCSATLQSQPDKDALLAFIEQYEHDNPS